MIKAADTKFFIRYGKRSTSYRHTAIRDKAIILTLIDTGIRATELCNLKVVDYDERRGRLYIRLGKGSKDRVVFAGKSAQKMIWRYLATGQRPSQTSHYSQPVNGSITWNVTICARFCKGLGLGPG